MSFLGYGNSTSRKLRAENTKNPRETRGKTALAATESPTNSADEAKNKDGTWSLKIEKKSLPTELIHNLIKKLVAHFGA